MSMPDTMHITSMIIKEVDGFRVKMETLVQEQASDEPLAAIAERAIEIERAGHRVIDSNVTIRRGSMPEVTGWILYEEATTDERENPV